MADAYLNDRKQLLPCAAQLNGEYGQKDIYVGVPCIIGAKGVEKIVEINGYDVEVPLAEHFIVMLYTDRPGIVAIYGKEFGEAGINIAGMQIARQSKGGQALSVLTVDSPVPDELLPLPPQAASGSRQASASAANDEETMERRREEGMESPPRGRRRAGEIAFALTIREVPGPCLHRAARARPRRPSPAARSTSPPRRCSSATASRSGRR